MTSTNNETNEAKTITDHSYNPKTRRVQLQARSDNPKQMAFKTDEQTREDIKFCKEIISTLLNKINRNNL